jgi:hypothetical protein
MAWSGKTTEGLASLSVCHKTAKIMSSEDVFKTAIVPALCFIDL